ncbi:M13 family metallopeptidase [Ferruginibacter lapsinanis]|uniref:M13 family metallopeptidase n=1 Tax=Ferruginibacter lapsinanis TaxID=563172 RepID=UPI001E42B73C|nr:M13 family metallopeptidase [Ferruginibacter lapsinanis]UEG49794.1 M13 family metallopeptidase [Ferruginibacter lapsinanis]
MKLPTLLFTLLFLNGLSANCQNIEPKKMIDSTDMDLTVKPGDDFFRFVNGNWIKNTTIPASKTSWGSFNLLAEKSSADVKTLTEYASKNTHKNRMLQMVGDFYTSGMDSINAEQLGYQPIKKDLERINAIKNIDGIITEITYQHTKGITAPLFNFSIYQDAKITTKYITHLDQGGTVLPDRDYYLKNDNRSIDIRKEYLSYIIDLFILTGTDSVLAPDKATTIIELETQLAKAQISKVELKNPEKTYNKLNINDYSKNLKAINLKILMQKMLVNEDSILSNNLAFLQTTDSLLLNLPLQTWKNYLQWYILKSSAAYLSNAFVERNFKYGKALSGQKAMTPRWQRVSYLTDNRLGDLLGQLYVKKYFTAAAKKRMLALVNNLQDAFKERIKHLDWMSDETKQKALIKLAAITKKIGYPDKWKSYDGVVITKNNYLQNLRNCAEWLYKYSVKRLGSPIDKTEWYFTPPTVNAYYAPLSNEIVFPAAILQPPFFDPVADDAFNYGGIGATIGHEMTHGFDDEGRKYDAEGNLNDWWTNLDAEKFKEKTEKIIAQFDSLTVLDTIHVNGKLTSGENIADLGGLNIAYDAFKKTAQGRSNKKIDGFTPDQRFFLSWSHAWRSKILPETAARYIIIDVHAPNEHRANEPLRNIDAFYKAFDIKPGDKMYKPEKDRIKIW